MVAMWATSNMLGTLVGTDVQIYSWQPHYHNLF